jgi:hypothetical protein
VPGSRRHAHNRHLCEKGTLCDTSTELVQVRVLVEHPFPELPLAIYTVEAAARIRHCRSLLL